MLFPVVGRHLYKAAGVPIVLQRYRLKAHDFPPCGRRFPASAVCRACLGANELIHGLGTYEVAMAQVRLSTILALLTKGSGHSIGSILNLLRQAAGTISRAGLPSTDDKKASSHRQVGASINGLVLKAGWPTPLLPVNQSREAAVFHNACLRCSTASITCLLPHRDNQTNSVWILLAPFEVRQLTLFQHLANGRHHYCQHFLFLPYTASCGDRTLAVDKLNAEHQPPSPDLLYYGRIALSNCLYTCLEFGALAADFPEQGLVIPGQKIQHCQAHPAAEGVSGKG